MVLAPCPPPDSRHWGCWAWSWAGVFKTLAPSSLRHQSGAHGGPTEGMEPEPGVAPRGARLAAGSVGNGEFWGAVGWRRQRGEERCRNWGCCQHPLLTTPFLGPMGMKVELPLPPASTHPRVPARHRGVGAPSRPSATINTLTQPFSDQPQCSRAAGSGCCRPAGLSIPSSPGALV